MEVDFHSLPPARRYATMIRAITPRPIAWVSTISPNGLTNLAPFSFFAGVGSDPPAIVFSIVNKPDGSPKDTLRNIRDNGEFVINLVPFEMRHSMFASSAEIPYETSEFTVAHLSEVPSHTVRPPRVLESPLQMECHLHQIVQVGTSHSIFGIIDWLHIDDRILDEEQKINPDLLDVIGRMGGQEYTRTTQRFELK
jgi:flavin reductase (DIM6/NTAB) family NADH-FMN oxidoreductase RutF